MRIGPTVYLALLVSMPYSGAFAAPADCAANFAKPDKGHGLLGVLAPTTVSYQSHALIQGVSQKDAFTRAYRAIIADGFSVTQSDRDVGAISAEATGNGGANHVILSFLIDAQPNGLDLSVKISASAGGMGHPEKHVCGPILAAAGEIAP